MGGTSLSGMYEPWNSSKNSRVRVEQRAVIVNRAILDGEWDLVYRISEGSPNRAAGPGRTAGGRSPGPRRSR